MLKWPDYAGGCITGYYIVLCLGLLHCGCNREVASLLRWPLTQVSLYYLLLLYFSTPFCEYLFFPYLQNSLLQFSTHVNHFLFSRSSLRGRGHWAEEGTALYILHEPSSINTISFIRGRLREKGKEEKGEEEKGGSERERGERGKEKKRWERGGER